MHTLILLALCQLGPVGAAPEGALPAVATHHVDLTADGALDQLRVGLDGALTVAVDVGGGRYQEIWQALPRCAVRSVLVSDLDGEGSVDLYLVSPTRNLALLGDGTGRLSDATIALGLSDEGPGLSAERVDADGDGWMDLLLHNATGEVLFRARPGFGFERVGPAVAGPSAIDASSLLHLLVAAAADPSLLGDGIAVTVGLGADGQLAFGLQSQRPPKADVWKKRDGPIEPIDIKLPPPPEEELPVLVIPGEHCDEYGLGRGLVGKRPPVDWPEEPPVLVGLGEHCDEYHLDRGSLGYRRGFAPRLQAADSIVAEVGEPEASGVGQAATASPARTRLWKKRHGPIEPIDIKLPPPPEEELPVLVIPGEHCDEYHLDRGSLGYRRGFAPRLQAADSIVADGGAPGDHEGCVAPWPGLACSESGMTTVNRDPKLQKKRTGSMHPQWMPTIPIDLLVPPPPIGPVIGIRMSERFGSDRGKAQGHPAGVTPSGFGG